MAYIRIALGVGCDRGTPQSTIEAAIGEALALAGLNSEQISGLASITLKADEQGLLACAAAHHWPLQFYTPEELASVEVPNPSATVLRHTGTPSVSEAAALLAARADMSQLILEKHRLRGLDGRHATVSIAKVIL
ncbi:cobalamin biosynthesis protein [Uliginosibacterium gangwonense]|uniref:cobalamin biosynthesis protein n=1 Tax=Uliginosibacterium gangwonense TaxID=392736 RepID=UPI00036CA6BA|nr:cobalamin biosynthesis protein [Uliginosibacterium gangwonense]